MEISKDDSASDSYYSVDEDDNTGAETPQANAQTDKKADEKQDANETKDDDVKAAKKSKSGIIYVIRKRFPDSAAWMDYYWGLPSGLQKRGCQPSANYARATNFRQTGVHLQAHQYNP